MQTVPGWGKPAPGPSVLPLTQIQSDAGNIASDR
jgi:hypothetical protein